MSPRKQTTSKIEQHRLMSYAEAAVYVGLSDRQLRRAVPAGRIPHIRFPGSNRVYFSASALDTFLAKCSFTPPDR